MADVGIKIKATDEASGVFSKVSSEASKLQGAVSSVGSSFAALGVAALAGTAVISFAGKIKETIDLADSFNKLSQKTGIAVEEFSKLNYAAGMADVSTETLAAGMRKLNISIAEAAGGNKEKAAVFNALGVSFKDAAGHALSADKVFKNLSEAMSKSADGAKKINVGNDLMGKGFVELVPVVNAGAKGLEEMGAEAKKLGIVIGADFAKSSEEFNDNIRKIQLSSQGLMVTLGSDFVKSWSEVAKAMADAAVEGGAFAAVYAGIQARLWGNDQYKNDKALVEQTELMLSLEKSLAVARTNGNAAYIKSREDALAAVNAEIKTTMAYRTLLQGVADDQKKNETVKPKKTSKEIERANALLGKSGTASKDTANPFAAEQDAAKEWAKAYEAAGKAREDLVAKNLGLSKSEEDLKRYMDSTAAAINEKTNPAMNAMVKSALEANIALEAMGNLADAIEAQQKRAASAEDETRKERDRVAAIGLTIEAVAELNATRLEEMATAKERSIMAVKEIDLSGKWAEAIRAEAKALRERAGLVRTGAQKESAVEAARAASDEWKRGWQETDNLARDVFSSWATDGGNAAQKIGDTLKKALLSAIYEATLKPLVFNMYSSLVGGSPSGSGGALGTLGAVGNAANGVGVLGNIGAATGLTAAGGAFSSGMTLGASGFGAGLEMMGSASGVSSFMAGAGQAAGSAFAAAGPYVLAAMVLKSAMDYKIESKGSFLAANLGATIPNSVGTRSDFQQTGGLFGGGTTLNSDWAVGDKKTADYITANVAGITAANKAYGNALGLTTTAIDGFTKHIEISIAGLDGAGQMAALDAALVQFSADQASAAYSSAISSFAKDGETATQTIARLATDITTVNGTFKTLGYALMDVSVAGADAADKLVTAFGGLQNFQAQTAGVYSNFYTAAEQKTQSAGSIATDLQAVGVYADANVLANASRYDWRAMIDQYAGQRGTDVGNQQYAAVVKAANSFAAFIPAFQESVAAIVAPASASSYAASSPLIADAALTAWQEATSAIESAMTDLRTTVLDSGPDAFAKLQAQFAIESASAKSGNVSAAQDLPALGKALVEAGKAFNTTSVAQSLLTARVLDTLGSVAGIGSTGGNLSIPRFASGGYHSGGWAIVGEQGPELVNMPAARVYTAADTRSMLGNSDPAVLEELRALRAELAAIRASTGSTASSAQKTVKIFDAAANGSVPLAVQNV